MSYDEEQERKAHRFMVVFLVIFIMGFIGYHAMVGVRDSEKVGDPEPTATVEATAEVAAN